MAATKTSPPRRRWSLQIEAASLRSRDPLLPKASRCFDRKLLPVQQMELIQELVTTRAAELTLAYRNVVMVAAGHKKRSDSRGRERLLRKPCVVLVVRDKWDPLRDAQAGEQLIPKRLLAFAAVDGQRILCAVPTDVQREQDFYGASPQSERAIYSADPFITDEFGTLTCVVRVGAHRRVLSCRHVLSPMPEIGGDTITADVPFAQLQDSQTHPGGQHIGLSKAIAGPLQGMPDLSFDAQLGSIDDAALPLLRTLLSDMPLSPTEPYVQTRERFDELASTRNFEILVPDNNPNANMAQRPTFVAQFEAHLPRQFHFDYPVRMAGVHTTCSVSHWELLKFKVAAGRVPLPGDSGSPVVARNSDGSCTLVGMHIAGIEHVSTSLALPSWQLFAASNYIGLSASTGMEPVNL